MPAQITPDQKAMRRFHEALRSLQRLSGRDFEQVIKSELGIVLSQTVRSMKKASVASLEKNHRSRPGAFYSVPYAGPTSRTGKQYSPKEIDRAQTRAAEARSRGKNGRALYYFPGSRQAKRYPDWLWRQIQEFRAQSLTRRKGARGLAAKMWVHIGNQLNIPVQAPAYVRAAKHHKQGDMSRAVMTRERGSGNTYELGFINALTKTNRWAGHAAKGKSAYSVGLTFRNALNRRANFFSQSMKLKAKGIIKTALDRYPGLARVS